MSGRETAGSILTGFIWQIGDDFAADVAILEYSNENCHRLTFSSYFRYSISAHLRKYILPDFI